MTIFTVIRCRLLRTTANCGWLGQVPTHDLDRGMEITPALRPSVSGWSAVGPGYCVSGPRRDRRLRRVLAVIPAPGGTFAPRALRGPGIADSRRDWPEPGPAHGAQDRTPVQDGRQRRQIGGHFRMSRAKNVFTDPNSTTGQWLGDRELSSGGLIFNLLVIGRLKFSPFKASASGKGISSAARPG